MVDWKTVGLITGGWIVSPIMSAAVAYIMFRFILRSVFYKRNPVAAAKHIAPYLVCMVLIVLIGVAVVLFRAPLAEWRSLASLRKAQVCFRGRSAIWGSLTSRTIWVTCSPNSRSNSSSEMSFRLGLCPMAEYGPRDCRSRSTERALPTRG